MITLIRYPLASQGWPIVCQPCYCWKRHLSPDKSHSGNSFCLSLWLPLTHIFHPRMTLRQFITGELTATRGLTHIHCCQGGGVFFMQGVGYFGADSRITNKYFFRQDGCRKFLTRNWRPFPLLSYENAIVRPCFGIYFEFISIRCVRVSSETSNFALKLRWLETKFNSEFFDSTRILHV